MILNGLQTAAWKAVRAETTFGDGLGGSPLPGCRLLLRLRSGEAPPLSCCLKMF